MKKCPDMLKVVLLGAGLAGENQAREIKHIPGVKLVGVYDPNTRAAQQLAHQYQAVSHADLDVLIQQTHPDIAAITSANHAHPQNVYQCIDAGMRYIFCEKPLAITQEDALRMTEMAEACNVKTSMGFAGIHVGYARVIEHITAGDLGEVLSLHLHTYRGYGFWGQERINARGHVARHTAVKHPEHSGGWTIHHACHLVHVMMQMAGEVVSVYGGIGSSHPDCPSEEMIHATLRFANGAIGTLLDSIGSFRGIRCGVIGTRATLVMHDDYNKQASDCIEVRMRYEGENADQVERLQYNSQVISRFAQFVEAIQNDQPSPITFRQGMENLKICQAIRHAGLTHELVHMNQFADMCAL